MGKRGDLPIMIGQNLRKGVLALRGRIGGFDLYIVWLKKDYEHGANYDLSDIEKVDAVLHFCDKKSVETTIDALKNILRMWGNKNG